MFPKVSTSKIKGLSPSLIMNGKKDQNRDTFCHEQLLELYKYFEETRDEYNLWRFSTGVFYQSNLLEDKLQNINTFTAVEVGCGPGMKSFSWAKKFKKYYGIDLDKYSIKSCEDTKRKFGFTNCEFICDRADQFIYKFDEKIDLLILYAVLEHLTLDERRVVLELANHVYENNGAIFIDETPNRLSPTDYHSFKLDFIQQCPPEIIHEYALEFSDRKELTDKMKGTDGITQTFRGGVGVSYHEFELWWKKFNSAGLLFDGYNSVALNLDPLRSEDLTLLDFFNYKNLKVPSLFSRYLINGLWDKKSSKINSKVQRISINEYAYNATNVATNQFELNKVLIDKNSFLMVPEQQGEYVLSFIIKNSGQIIGYSHNGQIYKTWDLREWSDARLPIWHSFCSITINSQEICFLKYIGQEKLQVFDFIVRT